MPSVAPGGKTPPAAGGGKKVKGKNFTAEEESQLCRSWLVVSQDTPSGEVFWEKVLKHYSQHKPAGTDDRPLRSLETKWSVIQQDVLAFEEYFAAIHGLEQCASSSQEELVNFALKLYKKEHFKHKPFAFLHCWWVLKDSPKWQSFSRSKAESKAGNRKRHAEEAAKREISTLGVSSGESLSGEEENASKFPSAIAATVTPSLDGSIRKRVKSSVDEAVSTATSISKSRAQDANLVHALNQLAAATMRKAKALEDTANLAIFTAFTSTDQQSETPLDAETKMYLKLRRAEILHDLKQRVRLDEEEENHVV